MSEDPYPVGHYRLIPKSEFCSSEQRIISESSKHTFNKDWFGFIKCKVLPPRGLYIPVLPYKTSGEDGKLLFGLCKTCMDTLSQTRCEHSEAERCFDWFGTTIELQKALSKGYELKEIYEVRHFDKSSTTLFKKYINHFMALKSAGFVQISRKCK